jgi:hypothetical protein
MSKPPDTAEALDIGGPQLRPRRCVLDDGTQEWRLPDGRRHRVGKPAVIYTDGRREWRQLGELHRTDGPALEPASATPPCNCSYPGFGWYLRGQRMSVQEWLLQARYLPGGLDSLCGPDWETHLDAPGRAWLKRLRSGKLVSVGTLLAFPKKSTWASYYARNALAWYDNALGVPAGLCNRTYRIRCQKRLLKNYDGLFGNSIILKEKEDRCAETAAHEIGHLIDWEFLRHSKQQAFGSLTNMPLVAPILSAYLDHESTQEYLREYESGEEGKDGAASCHHTETEAAYSLDPCELFADAVKTWVVYKRAQTGLPRRRGEKPYRDARHESLDAAFDQVFGERLGWLGKVG